MKNKKNITTLKRVKKGGNEDGNISIVAPPSAKVEIQTPSNTEISGQQGGKNKIRKSKKGGEFGDFGKTFGNIGEGIQNAAKATGEGIQNAAKATGEGIQNAAKATTGVIGDIAIDTPATYTVLKGLNSPEVVEKIISKISEIFENENGEYDEIKVTLINALLKSSEFNNALKLMIEEAVSNPKFQVLRIPPNNQSVSSVSSLPVPPPSARDITGMTDSPMNYKGKPVEIKQGGKKNIKKTK